MTRVPAKELVSAEAGEEDACWSGVELVVWEGEAHAPGGEVEGYAD